MANQKLNCCKKSGGGLAKGLLCGLIPHSGCLIFILLSIFGVTAFSGFFASFVSSRFFFHLLIALSFVMATVSAALYLKKNGILSFAGARMKCGYLFVLYGTTLLVNLLLFSVVFPYMANFRFDYFKSRASLIDAADAKLTVKVDIPCSGHAPFVSGELRKVSGVKEVKYRLPDLFDVYYNPTVISEKTILSQKIFSDFKAVIPGV